MFLGLYGGMMRGGNTDSTVVVADGPIVAPPVVSHAWSAIAMHDEFWPPVEPKLRPGGLVLVNDSTFTSDDPRRPVTVHRVPATDRRRRSRQPARRVDGDARRVLRDAPASSRLDALVDGDARSRSRRTAPSTSRPTSARSAPGWELAARRTSSRPGRTGTCLSAARRTTHQEPRHRHDRRRALQGLRALHPRVPAGVLDDVDRGEPHGLPLPRAATPAAPAARRACYVCPDFVFEVFRFETPGRDRGARHEPHDARARDDRRR